MELHYANVIHDQLSTYAIVACDIMFDCDSCHHVFEALHYCSTLLYISLTSSFDVDNHLPEIARTAELVSGQIALNRTKLSNAVA